MITILEHGTKKTIRCSCCGCKFMFDKTDVIIKKSNDVDYYIYCPECDTSIMVTSLIKHSPQLVKEDK